LRSSRQTAKVDILSKILEMEKSAGSRKKPTESRRGKERRDGMVDRRKGHTLAADRWL